MKHILFDLKDCLSNHLLDDEEYVKESLKLASEAAGCEILKIDSHKFDPQGVTAYALLAESHISIHTWPEKNVAKCDIFTCGVDNEPKKAVDLLHQRFKSQEIKRWTCTRSND